MSVWANIAGKLRWGVDLMRASLKGSERVASVEVFGSEAFRHAVARALLLLRDNNMKAWDTIVAHVSTIIEARRTNIVVTAHPAFMFVNGPDWRQEPELLAAVFAFMACSCQLHRIYEAEVLGRRVPREIFAGVAAQERCNDAYRECLLSLGKSPEKNGSRKGPYLN